MTRLTIDQAEQLLTKGPPKGQTKQQFLDQLAIDWPWPTDIDEPKNLVTVRKALAETYKEQHRKDFQEHTFELHRKLRYHERTAAKNRSNFIILNIHQGYLNNRKFRSITFADAVYYLSASEWSSFKLRSSKLVIQVFPTADEAPSVAFNPDELTVIIKFLNFKIPGQWLKDTLIHHHGWKETTEQDTDHYKTLMPDELREPLEA
jgi:hypothetical protein